MKYNSVVILGSTGSIGTQAIDVCKKNGIKVEGISLNRSFETAEAQIRDLRPRFCAVADAETAVKLKKAVSDTDTEIFCSSDGICEMIERSNSEMVLNAIVGCAGLLPSMTVLDCKKQLALANKETMVCGGEVVVAAARKNKIKILPVDSEHSAIFQCLECGSHSEVRRLILTASGGPFFRRSRAEFDSVTPADALAHPTWNMGAKITIDSATMMNKGFEVIEAARLFDIGSDRIDVIVHRESIIHSMVEYIDNVVMAQLGAPDMRTCIQFAMTYPERVCGVSERLDFTKLSALTFFEPDYKNFPLLPLAMDVADDTLASCAMNAANEIAVAAFLNGRISFNAISDTVISVTNKYKGMGKAESIKTVIDVDAKVRTETEALIEAL